MVTAPGAVPDAGTGPWRAYLGRFAPTPSGPLHAGSVVAALASWLDARAHRGRWIVRIEDTDTPRCAPGAGELILEQLKQMGMTSDEPVQWQSRRAGHYEHALATLLASDAAYGCACSRREIEMSLSTAVAPPAAGIAAVPYPGTCRLGTHGRPPRSWRVRTNDSRAPGTINWHDRRLGAQSQNLSLEVGDFIVRRADGLWAYQLAVVVDDGLQGITHVVRGEDLADNTPRQIHLQRLLGLATPQYLHTPLVLANDGQKLSKQTGALAVDLSQPIRALQAAASVLDLQLPPDSGTLTVPNWLNAATAAWSQRWAQPAAGPQGLTIRDYP